MLLSHPSPAGRGATTLCCWRYAAHRRRPAWSESGDDIAAASKYGEVAGHSGKPTLSRYKTIMDHRTAKLLNIGALIIALIAVALLLVPGVLVDPTPMLAKPDPDLDIPLGLLGFSVGLWAAYRITAMRYLQVASRRWGRWALRIMLPIWLCFGLTGLGNQIVEVISFRHVNSLQKATVLVVGKETSTTRRGRTFYVASVINPVGENIIELRVGQDIFDYLEPNRECVTLLIEKAPNNAVRIVKPLRWKVRCSQAER